MKGEFAVQKAIQASTKRIQNPGFLKKLVNSGFRGISVALEDKDILMAPQWEDNIRRIKADLDEAGITVVQTHLAYYNILRSCESTDDETDEMLRRSVAATGLLGAKWGAYHPRSDHSTGYNREKEAACNRVAIEKLLDTAEKYGSGIAVENIPVFPDCPQYNFFTSDPDEHLAFVDSFHSELVSACWDSGHANLMTLDQCESIRKLGNRIQILHLHDNRCQADNHTPPGCGYIDWQRLMDALRESGYTGSITLECDLGPDRILATYLAHCYDCACMLEEMYNQVPQQ